MTRYDGQSRCSGPTPLTFRWYGFPTCAVGDDLTTAVEVLLRAIDRPGRLWSPENRQMARSEFKNRIKRAQAGRLHPVDEVKAVDVKNPPPLYEIRWQHINVVDRAADGTMSFGHAVVRMYHSEPAGAPAHFIAHHAHEKDLNVPDINAAQQQEIKIAVKWHNHGVSNNWGIAAS